MKKIIMAGIALILAGCSYAPISDLRVSGDNAQLYQRDVAECKQLAKQVTFSWTLGYTKVVDQCLRGRGHSVLNVL